jgi:hypothetical protein
MLANNTSISTVFLFLFSFLKEWEINMISWSKETHSWRPIERNRCLGTVWMSSMIVDKP